MSQNRASVTGERISPHSRRLNLGGVLRRLREDQDFSIWQAAKLADMDRTLLNRIETGKRRVAPDTVMAIAEHLGIEQHSAKWQELYALARDAAQTGWWENRAFKGLSDRQALPANLEAGAARIRWYDFALIPGLLQSPAYLRARHNTSITADLTADKPVEIRARERRQQEVFVPGGPKIEAVVEETVIRRLMVPEDAMREQLEYLLGLIDDSGQVDFRVLPVGGELLGLRAPRSPVSLYDFVADDPPLAIAESLTGDKLLEGQELANHDRLWQKLYEIALPPDASRKLVAQSAAALSKNE